MVAVGWAGAFAAYLSVWKASEEIGIATWWLGPRSNPQPLVIRLIPFILVGIVVAATMLDGRHVPAIGVGGAIAAAAIAVPDMSRSSGLATIEFAIAGAVLLVSAASFTGLQRPPRSGESV